MFLTYCRGIDLSKWKELQKENREKADLEKFVQHVDGNHFIPNTVLVDCTSSTEVADHYHNWLHHGIHVITPNKKANSGPLDKVIQCYLLGTIRLWVFKLIICVTLQKNISMLSSFDEALYLVQYLKLRALQRQSFTHYFYEATVGAGLPIMHTYEISFR